LFCFFKLIILVPLYYFYFVCSTGNIVDIHLGVVMTDARSLVTRRNITRNIRRNIQRSTPKGER